MSSIQYPASSNISLAYDPLNRLTNMVDGVGANRYSYNQAGQLLTEDGPWSNDTVSYTYSNRRRVGLSLNSQPSTFNCSYGYDQYGRLNNITSPAGSFGYAYDTTAALSDDVAQLSLPGNAGLFYIENQFDQLARLTSTTLHTPFDWTANAHSYDYDNNNQRTRQTFKAGNTTDYTYDPIGQLKTALGTEYGGVTNRLQEQFGYAYDKAGNLNWRTNNALVQAFNVNNLNELTTQTNKGTLTVAGSLGTAVPTTSVTVSGTGLSSGAADVYGDATWARAGAAFVSGNNSYTASATDGYGRTSSDTVSVSLPGVNTFVYDLNGNLLSDGHRAFDYDDENQLIRITVTNAWKSEFTYDGMMRRRIRREYTYLPSSSSYLLTNEVRYVYDGNLVLQERWFDPQLSTNNPQQLVTYTRGNDLSGTLEGAGGIGGLLARSSISGLQSSVSYYHADGNGNITALVSTNGAVVARYQYDPYGNILAMSGPLAEANSYRFSSKEEHLNSGLVYYLYRYYEPKLQRWLNSDPSQEEGGINVSAFVFNSPINFADPNGFWGIQFGGVNIGYGDPNYVFDSGTDWNGYLGDVGDTAVGELKGAGAELSFGIYKPCYTSALQKQGGYVGTGLAMAGETLAGWGAAGKAARGATEYSHWIPARAMPGGRGSLLDKATRAARLNGNNVSRAEHALSDPMRYRFMPRTWKAANPLPNAFRQQLNRVPRFPLGMAVAAAGGYASSQGDGGCR